MTGLVDPSGRPIGSPLQQKEEVLRMEELVVAVGAALDAKKVTMDELPILIANLCQSAIAPFEFKVAVARSQSLINSCMNAMGGVLQKKKENADITEGVKQRMKTQH